MGTKPYTLNMPGYNTLGDILSGNAGSQPAGAAPATAGNPQLEQLVKLMGGDLSGSLSRSDKLMALGALMRSGARGSQITPQQVMSNLQQEKMAEIQNKLQIEQYRKSALDNAQLEAERANLINATTDPEMKRRLSFLSTADLRELFKEQIASGYKPASAASSAGKAAMDITDPRLSPIARAVALQSLSQPSTTIQGGQLVTTPPSITGTKTVNGVNYYQIGGTWYAENGGQ